MSLSGAWDEPQTAIFSKAMTKKGPYWRGNETVHHHKNTFHQAWREHLLGWVGCFYHLFSLWDYSYQAREVGSRGKILKWTRSKGSVVNEILTLCFLSESPRPSIYMNPLGALTLLLPWLNGEMSVHSWNRGLAWNVNFWKWPGQAFIMHSLRVYFFGSLNLGVYFSGFESCLCHFQHDFRWRFGFLILKKDEIIVKRIVLIS